MSENCLVVWQNLIPSPPMLELSAQFSPPIFILMPTREITVFRDCAWSPVQMRSKGDKWKPDNENLCPYRLNFILIVSNQNLFISGQTGHTCWEKWEAERKQKEESRD